MQSFVELSFARSPVYEVGAVLLALLSCPKPEEEARRAELLASLCGRAIGLQHLADPDDITPITIAPQYILDQKLIQRDTRFVSKRLGERLVAGRMMIPFLQRAAMGQAPPLPNGVKRLSLNEMSSFVLEDAGLSDPNNIELRIWRPSRPVIHLASALAIVGQQFLAQDAPLEFDSLLQSRELIEFVLAEAEKIAKLIASDPTSPVKADLLIGIRLV